MGITKYASLESAQTLDIRGSQERIKTASLDKLSDFDAYRTEDGYLYARIRAISSRVNKNNDGWPSVELAGSPEIFDKHQSSESGFTVEASDGPADYGFSTFVGKPIFVDHHNSDPERARGVIVDAKFHVEDHRTASLDPYYSSDDVDQEHLPGSWVELLLEVDANSFPKLAQSIVEGYNDSDKGIDGWSMGCDVERSVCNICKKEASSPDEYCNHVKLKGAHFDYIDPKTGHKTSKKSYENCYGIKFFEISAVFDPADETALSREVRSSVTKEAKTAEAPLPQSDLLTAPEEIDTLREENVCPVCGSTMEEHQCDVCGYVAPPPEFDNPDLAQAQQTDLSAQPDGVGISSPNQPSELDNPGGSPSQPTNPGLTASVTNSMAWQISVNPRLAGRINPVEVPVAPGGTGATNEPVETVVVDHDEPTTKRTAMKLIAAAKENRMSNKVAADAPEAAAPDKRVDVEGVGGVLDGSNEQASQADKQVDVDGEGGVQDASNQEATRPDSTQNVEKSVRTDDSGPTKTWNGTDGQESPVKGPVFPTSANKGTQPSDPAGKADDRIDVEAPPHDRVAPGTEQWTGTDGNGVTRQADPVTPESIAAEGWAARSHIISAFKLADMEIEMGLLDPEKKYDRVAELEQESPERIEASLKYAQRVKTAGLRKNAATKGVGRVPGLGRSEASVKEPAEETPEDDSGLFL